MAVQRSILGSGGSWIRFQLPFFLSTTNVNYCIETLPVVPYYDLDKDDKWVARLLKPNLGKMRKIPRYVAAGKVAATKSGKSVTYFHKSVQMLKDSGVILENEMSKPGHASTTWSPFGWFQWNNGSIKVAHD